MYTYLKKLYNKKVKKIKVENKDGNTVDGTYIKYKNNQFITTINY
jgi:hypothetical protein